MEKVNGKKGRQNIVGDIAKGWSKVMDSCISLVEIFIKGTLFKTKGKVMAKCSGLIQAFIRANGKMVHRMEKVKYI